MEELRWLVGLVGIGLAIYGALRPREQESDIDALPNPEDRKPDLGTVVFRGKRMPDTSTFERIQP